MFQVSETNVLHCPICSFSTLSSVVLERHVDFSHADIISPNSKKSKHDHESDESYYYQQKGGYKQQSLDTLRKQTYSGKLSVADFYNKKFDLLMAEDEGIDLGDSRTEDVIPPIKDALQFQVATWLSTSLDQYSAGQGDRGWGCGYRNIQNLLSSLLKDPRYSSQLIENSIIQMPSIPKLQSLIEQAWNKGIDQMGMMQLNGRLSNKKTWIGATEIVSLLTSLKIRTQLIDFYAKPGSHPHQHNAMFTWVREYFKKDEPFKHPLYFQHEGHSRTIIGFIDSSEPQLVILDPSISKSKLSSILQQKNRIKSSIFLHALSQLNKENYQIVAVEGIIDTEQELEERKVLKSTRIIS